MLFLLPVLSAQQTTFSHKAALEQNLKCPACHAAQKDSQSLSDRHKGKVLKDFNHQRHLSFGNIAPSLAAAIDNKTYLGSPNRIDLLKLRADLITDNPCEACHRGLRNAAGALTKAHFPNMEDCLVCHNKIDAPFSCEKCHADNFKLKPVTTHPPDFLDRHTTGKMNLDKTTCAACHGKRFTCQGCH